MAYLMTTSMALRGESMQIAELADLLSSILPNEGMPIYFIAYQLGNMECVALLLRLNKGKTNQNNENQLVALIRHKNSEVCAFGAVAFYLFYRWQIKEEQVPNFTSAAMISNCSTALPTTLMGQSTAYTTRQ